MRLRTWFSLGVLAALTLAVPVARSLHAGTVHPDCAGNSTCEMSRRDADLVGEFAVGLACYHGTSATLAVIALAPCQAYAADGTYIEWTQDVGWTYDQGDGTYYYGVHKSPGTAVAGWQTVAGTPYRWIKAATLPVVADHGFVLLGSATVVGPAVTAAVELVPRRFQPRATPQVVPSGVTRWLGSCPIAGRWPLWVADDVTSGTVSFSTACTLFPEWWGALGDGVTLDGLALWGMVSGINAAPAAIALTVVFAPGKTYLITGYNFGVPPVHREGLQPITKSDLEIVAHHSELKVPATYPYTNDGVLPTNEAGGLNLQGARTSIRGGIWNGNLRARTVSSGPANGPHDGGEVGLRLGKLAADTTVEQAVFKEWGTDNMYVSVGTEGALVRNSIFDRARRNNVTIVLTAVESVGTPDKPLIFQDNEFRNAAQYDLGVQRRPGSGVHIEGSPADNIKVSVHLINNIFTQNRNENIGLLGTGYRHVVKNNLLRGSTVTGGDGLPVYTGGILLGSEDMGGHVIQGNVFEDYGIVALYDDPAAPHDEPVIITGNVFRGTQPPVNTLPVSGQPTYAPPVNWVFANNSVPNLSKNAETYLKGLTHKVGYNVYSNPPQYLHVATVQPGDVATFDLQTVLPSTATYLVIAKGNGGAGAFGVIAMSVLVWNDSTLEASWDMIPPNGYFTAAAPTFNSAATTFTPMEQSCSAGVRKILRSGSVLTFDNSTCNQTTFFGLIAYQIGRGDWGT